MRTFSAEYLRRTRAGMWADSRAALAALDLPHRERVLDVGCGTGELSRVLIEEGAASVLGVDVDAELLAVAREHVPVVRGDAMTLPFGEDAADLVVCQALLINLPDPGAAVAEFARVSNDLVAAIEPDNGAVRVRSTVPTEARLSRRARAAYVAGVGTNVELGADAASLFEAAGLEHVASERYEHRRTIEPPYDADALGDARRKATGARLEETRATLLDGTLDAESYESLREDWRAMGRDVVGQIRAGEYEREEVVPFHVTVGRVSD